MGRGQHEIRDPGRDFERKMEILGSKLTRFRGGKMGKLGEMLDPLETKQIHGSKSTKHHQNQQITKKFGAIFGGDSRNLGRTQQNQARKTMGRGCKSVINVAMIPR